eukprot:GILI01029949.1.p1 GENE.GILI01029949.1~~GILI01029949.1.p1  ORF type:complete len:293 (+),score=66.48 GILI01029949.1:44-880(+)
MVFRNSLRVVHRVLPSFSSSVSHIRASSARCFSSRSFSATSNASSLGFASAVVGLVGFGVLSNSSPVHCDGPQQSDSVKESLTNRTFPKSLTSAVYDKNGTPLNLTLSLLGIGARCPFTCTIPQFRVYAVGVYADENALKAAGANSTSEEDLRAVLKSGASPVVVRLVMHKQGAGSHFAGGFKKSLGGIYKANGWTDMAGMEEFVSFFNRSIFPENSEILFVVSPNGNVKIVFDGTPSVSVKSPHLGDAIIDLYTSTNGVSSTCRKDTLDTLKRMLAK